MGRKEKLSVVNKPAGVLMTVRHLVSMKRIIPKKIYTLRKMSSMKNDVEEELMSKNN
jgi:hypothetical protein